MRERERDSLPLILLTEKCFRTTKTQMEKGGASVQQASSSDMMMISNHAAPRERESYFRIHLYFWIHWF